MKTCSSCRYSFIPPQPAGQPQQMVCQLNPPMYGGHVTAYIDGEARCQTIVTDPPVRPDRQACQSWEARKK